MPTTPFRLKRSKERISDLLKAVSGGKVVSLDALPPDLKEALDRAIQNDAEIPEQRMRRTMRRAAEDIGLRWDDDHPSNHPYRAQLDGQLYRERTLVAVVELETRNPKQIRGALIDLITYPEAKKILVIGESRVIRDAKKMKSEVLERFLPAIHKLLHHPADIGVLTEQEVSDDAELITEFIARPAPTNVGGG